MPENDRLNKARAFNFRPMVSAAFAVMSGAFLGAVFNLSETLLLAGCIGAAVLFTAAFLLLRKHKRLAGFMLVMVVGFAAMAVDLNVSQADYYYADYAEVSGRVCKETASGSYGSRFYIDYISVDGVEYYGVMEVNVPDESYAPDYELGDRVTLFCKVQNVDINPFSSDFSRYDKMGVTYKANLAIWRLPEGKEYTLTDKVMLRLDGAFSQILSEDERGVVKSLLFGDKSNLDAVNYENIRAAGLAHIFAVSGLHVGFLVGVAAFVFRKLRINDFLTCVFLAVILLTYGALCGFTSSLVRASVMTAVVFVAKLLKKRPDQLSTLGAAVFIIVLINPTAIFDLGFQMSVAAVGGIVLFAGPIAKKLENALKSHFVSQSVAMSVASTLGLFPVMTNVFNSFSLYFVLANLVCLPLVSVLFVYLAVSAVVCLIVPAAAPILYPAKYLSFAIMRIVEATASLPFAVIGTMSIGAVAVVYIVTLVNLSRFNMLGKTDKAYLTVLSVAAAVLLFVLFYSEITVLD